MPPEQRLPFYVFLDEVQTYDGAASGNLAALLEQTAKYGIRGFLLNQNPERLTSDTLNALTTNRSHLITTALNAHAAGLIAREWGGDPPASAITGLPRRTFIAQVTHNGRLTRPFLFGNESVEERFAEAFHPDALAEIQPTIDAASGRTPAGETVTALDTLDERIRQHLESKQGDGAESLARGLRAAVDRAAARALRSAVSDERPPGRRPAAARGRDGSARRPLPAPSAEHQPAPRALHTTSKTALDATGARAPRRREGSSIALKVPAPIRCGSSPSTARTPSRRPARAPSRADDSSGQRRRKDHCAKHTLRVNDVGIAFVRAARERGDECGPESWRHEIAHPISPARGRRPAELAVADALLTYLQTGEDGSLALHQRFIELDRGTARPAEQLAAKITRYTRLRYYTPPAGSANAPAEPLWRSYYRSWPHLLIVLADQSRERMRQRIQRTLVLHQSDPAKGRDGRDPPLLRRPGRPDPARAVRADLHHRRAPGSARGLARPTTKGGMNVMATPRPTTTPRGDGDPIARQAMRDRRCRAPLICRSRSGRARSAPASGSATDGTCPSQTVTQRRCCPRSRGARSASTAAPATSCSTRCAGSRRRSSRRSTRTVARSAWS